MVGIIIAIVLRGLFIWLGAAAIEQFSWVFYIFGAFLLYTAWKLIREGESDDDEYEENRFMKFVESRFPATKEFDGTKLFTLQNGKRLATPLFFVIIALGTTDLLFALDSIPAIYGLTDEPYIVLTANLFALMGLRQLYFLIGGLLKRLVYLSIGLAVLLAFIGVKLLLHALHENELPFINGGENVSVPEIPIWMSLAAIVLILGTTTVLSLMKTRRDERDDRSSPDPARRSCLRRTPPGPCARRGPRTSAEAATTRPMPSSWVGRQHLPEHDQPGEGGGRRLEAEQDAEHLRRQPPQRQQLERVGQHRRQHRDAEPLEQRLGRSTAAPTPGRTAA